MEIRDLPYVLVNYRAPNEEQGQLCTLNEISDKHQLWMWTPDCSGEEIGIIFLVSLLTPWVDHPL